MKVLENIAGHISLTVRGSDFKGKRHKSKNKQVGPHRTAQLLLTSGAPRQNQGSLLDGGGEEISNHAPNKGLIPRNKQLRQHSTWTASSPVQTQAGALDRWLSEETDRQMAPGTMEGGIGLHHPHRPFALGLG